MTRSPSSPSDCIRRHAPRGHSAGVHGGPSRRIAGGLGRLGSVLAAATLAVLAAGCWFSTATVNVRNETDAALTFGMTLVDGTLFPLTDVIGPGEVYPLLSVEQLHNDLQGVDGCTVGDLIAYGLDGTEVARHPPPLCSDGKRGPDLWVIEASGAPSSAPPSSASL